MFNPNRKFTGTLLSNCTYYPGAKPGKKHALNKQYALNSEMRLLTHVYGSCLNPKQPISWEKDWAGMLTTALLVSLCVQELPKKCPSGPKRCKVYWNLVHSRIDDYSQANIQLFNNFVSHYAYLGIEMTIQWQVPGIILEDLLLDSWYHSLKTQQQLCHNRKFSHPDSYPPKCTCTYWVAS